MAAVAPAKQFRISGVAVSSRDGSPIPYCRLTATVVTNNTGPQNGGRRPGFGGEDFGGFAAGALSPMINFGGQGGDFGGRRGPGQVADQENATTADAQGHFTLSIPHGGPWRLTGVARGFRSQSFDEHDGLYAQIVLSDAAPAYSLTFRMAREAIVSGFILDEAGEAVRNARVTAELVPIQLAGQIPTATRAVANSQTDDRGHYELSGLAPGNYHIRVQGEPWYAAGSRTPGIIRPDARATAANANDFGASYDPPLDLVYPITWFPGADSSDAAETIALAGGDERQADFHLNAISSIHLRVPMPEGLSQATNNNVRQGPRPMASITKVAPDGAPNAVTSISTTGNGDWDFGGLTPGIYEVRMPGPEGQPGGGEVEQVEITAGSHVVTMDSAKPLTKVTLKVDGTTDQSFPFVEFVDLATGRRVVAQQGRGGGPGGRGGRGRRGDDADSDEPPTLTASLPRGRYAVSVGGNGGLYLSSMTATDAQVFGHTVEIAGGAPTLSLTVSSGRAELNGIVGQGSQAVEGAMVLLVPITLGQPGDTSLPLRAESNSDGSFSFRSLQPGRYIAVAIDRGWQLQWTSLQTLTNYLAKGAPVELKAGVKLVQPLTAALP